MLPTRQRGGLSVLLLKLLRSTAALGFYLARERLSEIQSLVERAATSEVYFYCYLLCFEALKCILLAICRVLGLVHRSCKANHHVPVPRSPELALCLACPGSYCLDPVGAR